MGGRGLRVRASMRSLTCSPELLLHSAAIRCTPMCNAHRCAIYFIPWGLMALSGGRLLSRVVPDEAGHPVEGGVAFVEDAGECLEDVRDAGGDVQDDGHVVGGGLHGEAGGVVEEHFV